MHPYEKAEIARALEKLGVDVIEAGFAASNPADAESIRNISGLIRDSQVCSMARARQTDIDIAWEALRTAVAPRIHVFLATSDIHLQYKLKMTREQALEIVRDSVAYARRFCSDVEFTAEDATRTDPAYLLKVCRAAALSGATVLNLPDTVGYATYEDIRRMFLAVKNLKETQDCILAAHCHNDMGMATANTLAAVEAGALQVEGTVNGIGERAGNAALEEIIMALRTRQDRYQSSDRIDSRRIYRTSRLVQTVVGIPVPPNKAVIGANAFAHEAGIHQHGVMSKPETYEIMRPEEIGIPRTQLVLGRHSGRHAFDERLDELGYHLTRAERDQAFEKFKVLCERKKVIHDHDIEALIGAHIEPIEGYTLVSFSINRDSDMSSTSTVVLNDGMKDMRESAMGDGPVDSSYKAINGLTGMEFTLDQYHTNSVTGGEDALVETIVHMTREAKSVIGRGVSTDVVEASIRAYLNGVNKYIASVEARKQHKGE